jgi:acetyl-CoA carboxylase biotin carboxyl carrier protein
MDLTNDDVADILALLDSLPYDELDLETPSFRLTLRRAPGGWTQSTVVQAAAETATLTHRGTPGDNLVTSLSFGKGREGAAAGAGEMDGAGGRSDAKGDGGQAGGEQAGGEQAGGEQAGGEQADGGQAGGELVVVRAPLPGTFYRAPRPGAAPFVEVGSRVDANTVIGIVETMKLMNSVHAGVAGTVAEFCVRNAEFAAHGAALLRIRADR